MSRTRLAMGRGWRPLALLLLLPLVWQPLAWLSFLGASLARGRRSAAVQRAVLDDFDSDEFGGSILEQMGELDKEEGLATDVILEEVQAQLERQVQVRKDRHEQAVLNGKRMGHAPVLLYTSLEFLFPPEKKLRNGLFEGNYVDATFGRGGHSREILTRLAPSAKLFAFDVDPEAVEAGKMLEEEDPRFKIIHRWHSCMDKALKGTKIDGVIMDVGVSSPMLDNPERGFSLQNLAAGMERALDLRMNPEHGMSAAELLQSLSTEELATIFRMYGPSGVHSVICERVAQAIMDEQELNGPYTTMQRFAETIAKEVVHFEDDELHPRRGMDHPAKLWVHALRIYLNQELTELENGLKAAFNLMSQGARCVIAVFKRSEQEVVQRFIVEHEDPNEETEARVKPRRRLAELYPLVGTSLKWAVTSLNNRPTRASSYEVNKNRRARSSSLFILEKVQRRTKQCKAKPRLLRNRFKEVGPPKK